MGSQEHFAIVLGELAESEPGGATTSVAVFSSTQCMVLHPENFIDLMLVNDDLPIACCGIGDLLFSLEAHLRRRGSSDHLRSLFSIASAGRFHDIQILDQLLDLARCGSTAGARSIQTLLDFYTPKIVSTNPVKNDPFVADYVPGSDHSGSPGPLLLAQAKSISRIYRVQIGHASKIAGLMAIPGEIVEHHGPLSVGLQGRGAIALTRIERNFLSIRKDALDGARSRLQEVFRESSQWLHRDLQARCCFHWDENEVKRSKNGLPDQITQKLQAWLEKKATETPTIHGIPLLPPLSPKGEISTIGDFWGDELILERGLREWVRLWTSSQGLATLGTADDTHLRPAGFLFPRMMTRKPGVARLRRMGLKGIFEAGAGRTLIVGRLQNLALLCFAADIEGHGQPSTLANLARDGVDLIHASARFLYGQRQAYEVTEDESSDEFEDLADQARRAFDDAKANIDRSWWVSLAGGLIDALVRGLNARLTREMLRWNADIELTPSEIQRNWAWLVLISQDFPGPVTEDRTFELLLRHLQCRPEELAPIVNEQGNGWGLANIRKSIIGRRESPKSLGQLRSICRNEFFADKLSVDHGSPELFRELFSDFIVSTTGRVRYTLALTETRTMTHQDLADDVMKSVLFEMIAAGFEPVAWDGEEFVVRIEQDRTCPETLRQLEGSARAAVRRVIPSVPIPCRATCVQVW